MGRDLNGLTWVRVSHVLIIITISHLVTPSSYTTTITENDDFQKSILEIYINTKNFKISEIPDLGGVVPSAH